MSYLSPYSIAQELRDEIDEAIRGADLPDGVAPVVEVDPVAAASALNNGDHVVLIPPPAVEYVTVSVSECEWDILVVAPIRDAIEAWPYLDAVTNVVATALNATSSRYGSFQPAQGEAWPCSIVTTTTST